MTVQLLPEQDSCDSKKSDVFPILVQTLLVPFTIVTFIALRQF